MDKRVVFAVAGSGKTTLILSKLGLETKALIVTYTVNNVENLREGIIRKFGYFPPNIKLLSYFNFLYGFCFRPFLGFHYKAKGINWNSNPNQYAKEDARYIDGNRRLYSNRMAKLLERDEIINDVLNIDLQNTIKMFFLTRCKILEAMTLILLKILYQQA
jgi:DNA helicase-2/ATP-dependent DNA helicase PcrA